MDDLQNLECRILHLVKPEDLNHHGTLFAGQMAKWLVEAGLMTVSRLVGKPEDVVCVQLNGMTFKKPVNNGDLIEVRTRVAHTGATSITVVSEVFRQGESSSIVRNIATFVTVDKQNKPYRHGIELPAEYINANRDIVQEVLRIKNSS